MSPLKGNATALVAAVGLLAYPRIWNFSYQDQSQTRPNSTLRKQEHPPFTSWEELSESLNLRFTLQLRIRLRNQRTGRNIPLPLLFTAANWVWIISVTFIRSFLAAVRGRSKSELHAALLQFTSRLRRDSQGVASYAAARRETARRLGPPRPPFCFCRRKFCFSPLEGSAQHAGPNITLNWLR
ncbi:hypothetical protein JEQ12_012092 [Ovis aries]|uniref:Uncharacterized protein n=1 Tax=Ovis aries TaxID=9940 RepID=A0A835ZJJ8_SHEEP|nr:hypothetical protein JEQ12_012092 [Ovis aries]